MKNILRIYHLIPLSIVGTLIYWFFDWFWFLNEVPLGNDRVAMSTMMLMITGLFSAFIEIEL